jgi:3-dehydroquinate synthase
LNYGHTFGHALEAATRYTQLLHGEAVSIGMLCASRLAERLGMISSDLTQRQRDLLARFSLPIDVPAVDLDLVLRAMQQDKKVAHGRLRFVLPTKLGHVELCDGIDEDLVREAITS